MVSAMLLAVFLAGVPTDAACSLAGCDVAGDAATEESALLSVRTEHLHREEQTASGQWLCMAHMVNSVEALQYAYKQGAAGLEIDVQYENGFPTKAKHGFPSDCVTELVPSADNVCSRVSGDTETPIREILAALAKTNTLVYIDSKIDSQLRDVKVLQTMGLSIAELLISEMFEKGFAGQVVLGCPTIDDTTPQAPFLKAAADKIKLTKFEGRVVYALDYDPAGDTNCGFFSCPDATLRVLVDTMVDKLKTISPYRAISAGITVNDVHPNWRLAVKYVTKAAMSHFRARHLSFPAIAWTFVKSSGMNTAFTDIDWGPAEVLMVNKVQTCIDTATAAKNCSSQMTFDSAATFPKAMP